LLQIPSSCRIFISLANHQIHEVCSTLSESVETMKKRLEFLVNERQQKAVELQQLGQQAKSAGTSAILAALTGDASTRLLHQQQIIDRMRDISGQIRKLDFEISTLETEIKEREEKARQCPSCRKDISQFPAEIIHCPFCGSKL
jgi:prefoldin subunit 5